MEHISNEQKAKKIIEQYKTRYNDTRDLLWEDLEDIALQAMKLKDKEWADRFKEAFQGMWTASFNVDNLSSKTETTIEFKLVTRE